MQVEIYQDIKEIEESLSSKVYLFAKLINHLNNYYRDTSRLWGKLEGSTALGFSYAK